MLDTSLLEITFWGQNLKNFSTISLVSDDLWASENKNFWLSEEWRNYLYALFNCAVNVLLNALLITYTWFVLWITNLQLLCASLVIGSDLVKLPMQHESVNKQNFSSSAWTRNNILFLNKRYTKSFFQMFCNLSTIFHSFFYLKLYLKWKSCMLLSSKLLLEHLVSTWSLQ